MKAIIYSRFGPPEVLELKEIPKPTPKDHEVLIKVHATTVSAGDWRARTRKVPKGFGPFALLIFGFSRPRMPILGTELSGEIESVGESVRRFKVGDQVFAYSGAGMGCYVEYKCMLEDGKLALKPANLNYEEAAAISSCGTTALAFFRRAKIQNGDKVLINGASGGVGTAAVQLARHFGAEVTGVCSTGNVDMVRSIGADSVIDYTREDFTKGTQRYDLIYDCISNHSLGACRRVLNPNGKFVIVGGKNVRTLLSQALKGLVLSRFVSQSFVIFVARLRNEDLIILSDLMQGGKVTPVIDRTYPLSEAVEAFRRLETGHARGKVVITVDRAAERLER